MSIREDTRALRYHVEYPEAPRGWYATQSLTYFSVNLVGHYLIVIGRIGQGRLCIIDLKENRWRWPSTTNVHLDMANHCTVLVDDKLISVCGTHCANDVDPVVFDVVADTWETGRMRTVGKKPVPRNYPVAEFLERPRWLVIFGGLTFTQGPSNDLSVLDVDTKTWLNPVVKGQPPSPRYSHCSCCVGHNLFVYAGCGDTDYFNDLFCLSQVEQRWQWSNLPVKGYDRESLVNSTLSYVSGKIIIYGGFDNHLIDQSELCVYDVESAWLYSAESDAFGSINRDVYSINRKLPVNSSHRAVVTSDQKVILIGGFTLDFPQYILISSAERA